MTAKLGPSGVNLGETYRTPSGKVYRIADWSPSAGGWRCFPVIDAEDRRKPPPWSDEGWTQFSHEFLVNTCWRLLRK